MASSWRSTGLASLGVVVTGGFVPAALRGTDAARGAGTGIAYPDLRPPDYRKRLRQQTAIFTGCAVVLSLMVLLVALLIRLV